MSTRTKFINERLPLGILLLLFLVIGYLVLAYPLGIMHSDNFAGFLALKSYLNGAELNTIRSVSILDPNDYETYFVSWYSPGQYALPYFVQRITGLSFVASLQVFTILELIVLTAGFIKLFRYFGYSNSISYWSVVIILLTRTVLINFVYYGGGDFILLSAMPWLILMFVWITKTQYSWYLRFLLAIIFVLLGTFLKLTFIVLALGLAISLLVSGWKREFDLLSTVQDVIKKHWPSFVGFLFAVIVVQVFYLSINASPNSYAGFNFKLKDTIEMLCSPLALFNFDYISSGLMAKSKMIGYGSLVLKLFLSAGILYYFAKKAQTDYRWIVFSICGAMSIYFLYSFNFATVYGGSRHVIYISALLIPTLVQLVFEKHHMLVRLLIVGIIGVGSLYGMYSVRGQQMRIASNKVVGNLGYDYHTHTGLALSKSILEEVLKIDASDQESLVLTNIWHVCLDLQKKEYAVLTNDFEPNSYKTDKPLYIVLDKQKGAGDDQISTFDSQKLESLQGLQIIEEDERFLFGKVAER